MVCPPEHAAEPASSRVRVNAVALHCAVAGPETGPLVVLLHGFPEFSYGWRQQIAALADAGFRVLAPDGRGYGTSDKPAGLGAYHLDELARDVAGLIRASGRRSACLAGHDWGGIVAWWTAVRHPEVVSRLAALNAPHPSVLRAFVKRHPGQALRSWYAGFFQLPAVPEWLARRRDYALLRSAMTGSARPGTFSSADFERYRQAWAEPGALTAMLNWYRALRRFRPDRENGRIRQPALILWGDHDRFLDRRLAEASAALCDRAEIRHFPAAGHWLQHEEPEAVNAALAAFFSER